MRRVPLLITLAGLLALAGCTGPTTSPTSATTSPTPGSPGSSADAHGNDTPTAAPGASPTPRPGTATVDLDGAAGRGSLLVETPAGATVTTRNAASGSTRVTVRHLARGRNVVVRATDPASATLQDELDETFGLVTSAGTTLGGLARPGGGIARGDEGTVVVTASGDTVTLWLGTGTPRSATWGVNEGGRSIAVDANAWARASAHAGAEATWSALVVEQPDADVPGMHDQLLCHALGAPDKPTWNLEPWRPDVGLVATLAAGCNPT
ncbi:hypothetical protein GCM10025864_21600 [Luteimicrobium album]|uniref:DUF2599 domain-containing protein n=1 Tax=Luteimicrobium album TaxID=1054550 RepID=A0ABQ6I0W8_9MICO|nr:DUF2599 domain-containing protein [Luteimicrobium album]GMA24401.1 hypothetical protein GCM10025864_21600 [Luteimicrobium album]